MIAQEKVTINNPSGLHARPAANLVKTANMFKASIKVRYADREVDAKSILGVLSLGAGRGSIITLSAEGEDAIVAVNTLKGLAEDGFGES